MEETLESIIKDMNQKKAIGSKQHQFAKNKIILD